MILTFNDISALEVFEVAKTALDDDNLHVALNNMQRAREMFLEINDIPKAMLAYDYVAYLMHAVRLHHKPQVPPVLLNRIFTRDWFAFLGYC